MNPSQHSLNRIYIAAAAIVCIAAVTMRLTVPEGLELYVNNGLTLPAFRYGLLFALIACGMILSDESRPLALAANLAVFVAALWFGHQRAEAIILSSVTVTELVLGYPVVTSTMGMITGATLLLPLGARRWLVPFVCAICGFGFGLFIIMESPFDYFYRWFSVSAALGGMAVVIASIALTSSVRRIIAGSSLAIAERIFGSWLIAASLLLAALAFFPQPAVEPDPMSTVFPDLFNPPEPQ